MKFKQITALDFTGDELEPTYWSQIARYTKKVVRINNPDSRLPKELNETDCLLVKLGVKVDKELIDSAPNLRYIGMLGTGYGGIDTVYAASKGIAVVNIANYATEGVTELSFGILLDQLRDISRAKTQAKMGDYNDAGFNGQEIRGKNFGVIGLGDIGSRTALLAQAFGADVQYWSRNRKKQTETKGITYCELDDLIESSSIISLNLALNSGTEGIIDKKRINSIRKGAIVINPCPMELVDFDALVVRLKKKDITFILDHSDEMTGAQLNVLKRSPNCVIYPPIGYLTEEASKLKQKIYIDNLKNYLAGNLTNKVN